MECCTRGLGDSERAFMVHVRDSLVRRLDFSATTEVFCPRFLEQFARHLRMHHAASSRLCSAETFEHVLHHAAQASGLDSQLSRPGAVFDITIGGVPISCKSSTTAMDTINISKVCQLSGVRETLARSPAGFSLDIDATARTILDEVLRRVSTAQMILFLRARWDGALVRYQLFRIPHTAIGTVHTFRRTAGGSLVYPLRAGGSLIIDVSAEKASVRGMPQSECQLLCDVCLHII